MSAAATGSAALSGSAQTQSPDAKREEDAFRARFIQVPQQDPMPLSQMFPASRLVRPVRPDQVEDLRTSPGFSIESFQSKPLLLTPAETADPAWSEGKTHVIVNGVHRHIAKGWGLSEEQRRQTKVYWVELRYKANPETVVSAHDWLRYGYLENRRDGTIALQDEADHWFRAWDTASNTVPAMLQKDPKISSAKQEEEVCRVLCEEGAAKSNVKSRVSLAVAWCRRPKAAVKLMEYLAMQCRRPNEGAAKRSETLVNYVALSYAVPKGLPGVPEHLKDDFLVWCLETVHVWTGTTHGPRYKNMKFRVRGPAGNQFWRVLLAALVFVVAVAEDAAKRATTDGGGSPPALRVDDTLSAELPAAADAAGAGAGTKKRTIGSRLRTLLHTKLHLLHDDRDVERIADLFLASEAYDAWRESVRQCLLPAAPTATESGAPAVDPTPKVHGTPGPSAKVSGAAGGKVSRAAGGKVSGGTTAPKGGDGAAVPPGGGPSASAVAQEQAADAGAAASQGTPRTGEPEVFKEAVGPARAWVLGYPDVLLESDSHALTRLTPELRLDNKGEPEGGIDPALSEVLAARHQAHWLVTADTWNTFSEFVRRGAAEMVPRPMPLLAPDGRPLGEAAQPVLERLLASQTWVHASATLDAQGWFVFDARVLPGAVRMPLDAVVSWSRKQEARDVWVPSFEGSAAFDSGRRQRGAAAQMRTAAGSALLSAVEGAGLQEWMVGLDAFVAVLVRSLLGDALPKGVQVGETGGRLRRRKMQRSAAASPAYYDGPVRDAAVAESPPGAPLVPRSVGVVLTGPDALELEVVRGSHLHLRRRRKPWAAMKGPFEALCVPPNSALVYDGFLVRRLPSTTKAVDVVWYEVLLCSEDRPNLVFVSAAPPPRGSSAEPSDGSSDGSFTSATTPQS